jgi:hypothetical protein
MLENLEPLRWQEIVDSRKPEELPFLKYFEEMNLVQATEER